MKKLYTLVVMAFIAIAANAQTANMKESVSENVLSISATPVNGLRNLSKIQIPENAIKLNPSKKAPKKAISSVNDLAGNYEWTYNLAKELADDLSTIEDYQTNSKDVQIVVSDATKNEIQIIGMMQETLTATVEFGAEIGGSTYNLITIPCQFAYTSSSYGKCDLTGVYYDEDDSKWYMTDMYGMIQEDGSIILINWMLYIITEGKYQGYNLTTYFMPYSILEPADNIADVAATPANPSFEVVYPYDADKKYGVVILSIPTVDINDNPIRKDKLYYQIWKEEGGSQQVYTFEPTLYETLEESMTEIPYKFNDNFDFDEYEGYKRVFLNFDYNSIWSKVGVQSIYKGGGKTKKSDIIWYNLISDGISTIKAEKTDGAIYSIDGRRLNEVPATGLYIQNGKKYVVK